MQPISERLILIIIGSVMSVATLFCLIGLVTPGWSGHSVFSGASSSSAALSIISLLLLIGCVVMTGIILLGIMPHKHAPFIFVSLLIISSIFLLATFASLFSFAYNYSYNLMATAFTFTYLSSIIATYWLFGIRGTHEKTVKPDEQQQQQQQQQQPRLDMS